MTGFSSTSLSSLTFTTTTSISTLGSLTGWSSAQVNIYYIHFKINIIFTKKKQIFS